jgi:hypothetical protein
MTASGSMSCGLYPPRRIWSIAFIIHTKAFRCVAAYMPLIMREWVESMSDARAMP